MGRKQKKYNYIYKTTNLINEKYYIGMHSTDNLNDGYLGSGYKIRRSIKKYGKEIFKLEILEMLPDRNSLKEREKELVNGELLKDPMCMNLTIGGEGGFISFEGVKLGRKKCNEVLREKYGDNFMSIIVKNYYKNLTEEQRKERGKQILEGQIRNGFNRSNNFKGKKHTEETKRKIGLKNSLKQKGENNSQYGTMWITNGIENKKIKKDSEIQQGWCKGRNKRI